ncbi:type IV pilus assembly protein FimV [Kistimonas asteriae]|uniref:type IV pilus assembly protein FimV n=1 Tax=Kistimonas asteriae TaxID=517724 RepID=UPI001BA63BF3|nr:hypothetical protein [Kistimonas asteriae]
MFLISVPAHAIEFSAVKLLSGLNEPLRAEIEVSGLADPESPFIVDVASPLDHQRYNIPHQFFNADIRTTWHRESDGRVIIRLSSTQPVTQENLRFLMLVMPTEIAMLKEVDIWMPDAAGANHQQVAASQFDFRKSSKAMYGRSVELPALSDDTLGLLFRKKIKTVGKLDQTLKLVRHNEQRRPGSRALAFASVTDEITYDPHFSPEAIAAVMPKAEPVNKPTTTEPAQPVLAAALSDEENQNENKSQTFEIPLPDEQVIKPDDRMAILTAVDKPVSGHALVGQKQPSSWITYKVIGTDSLDKLAAGLAKRHGSYPQAWRERIIKANPQLSMTTEFPPPGTAIKIPFMTRHVTLSTMDIYIHTGQAYAIHNSRGPPGDWDNRRL